ncbi:MAG: hypothetical protein HYY04_11215 [Chloroflexi bacterium]|nr:hypothetical protein [Chloroflexota bacterium]
MAHRTTERSPEAAQVDTRSGRGRRGRTRESGHPARPYWLAIGLAVVLVAALAALLAFPAGRGGSGAIAVLQTDDFHSLAFSPDDPSVVFFGHHNGVLRSDDGGRTWRPLVEQRNFDAMGLAVSRANPRQVYLAGHDLFQVSADGGVSWQPVAHNLPGTDIHGFATSPDDPNRHYAFVVGHGLFASADSGRTWQKLPGQLPRDVMALAAAGGSPETLYAGSMRSGVLRSGDGGQSWAPAMNGLDSSMVYALAVDPTARQTVYAGVDGGLYKSTDGGARWTRLPFPGENAAALAVSPSLPNVVLAIHVKKGEGGLIFRSEDSGATWGGR